MKASFRKIAGLLAASASTVALASLLSSARGDYTFAQQSHCVAIGIACADCINNPPGQTIGCIAPIPKGDSIGDCQQSGSGCYFDTWDCGAQYDCATSKFNGNNCNSGWTICH
jgi:hypothetical protein